MSDQHKDPEAHARAGAAGRRSDAAGRGYCPEAVTLGEMVDAGDDKPIASLQVLLAGWAAQDWHWTLTARQLAQASGRMFWFMRKKFFGSYFDLICARRS